MSQRQETSRPATTAQLSSHGRGGAGNMANTSQSPKLTSSDLETPILKKPVVTTGRGGTGNMAKNDDPQETRLRQDVEAVPRSYSSRAQHTGRGGAGNVFRDEEELVELAQKASREQAFVDDSKNATNPDPSSATTKRKNWLFGKRG